MDDYTYTLEEYQRLKQDKDAMRRFREHEARKEAMKKHPASKTATENTTKSLLSDEMNTYLSLTIFKFFFVVIPLALLFTGIAVVPAIEAIFSTEIGYWTAFFFLMTIRWLILQPRNSAFLEKVYEEGR